MLPVCSRRSRNLDSNVDKQGIGFGYPWISTPRFQRWIRVEWNPEFEHVRELGNVTEWGVHPCSLRVSTPPSRPGRLGFGTRVHLAHTMTLSACLLGSQTVRVVNNVASIVVAWERSRVYGIILWTCLNEVTADLVISQWCFCKFYAQPKHSFRCFC